MFSMLLQVILNESTTMNSWAIDYWIGYERMFFFFYFFFQNSSLSRKRQRKAVTTPWARSRSNGREDTKEFRAVPYKFELNL